MKLVSPSPSLCDVRDLCDGRSVDQVLFVREREIRRTRTGADYMRLSLADRTGVVPAIVWNDVEEAAATATAGEPVRVIGTFSEHPRYGPQLTVQSVLAPLEVDWERLLDSPATLVAELERRLDAHIARLTEPHLAALTEQLLGHESERGALSGARSPPSTTTTRTTRGCSSTPYRSPMRPRPPPRSSRAATATSPPAARCCTTSASSTPTPAMGCGVALNDAGRLIGEIPGGYYTVRREIEGIPGFPPELAQALLHIILSHHGCLEYGSPVVPATREALLVHTMDKLSGDLGSFDRLERETAEGETWSRYDRALGRAVWLTSAGDESRRCA